MLNQGKEAKMTQNGGIGFTGLLTLIFVCAKIFGIAPVASWSWIWIFSPIWIGFVIWFLLFLFVLWCLK